MANAKKVDFNERVAITNIRPWNLYFKGIETTADIVIPAKATNYKKFTVAEIDAQVKSGNKFFVGSDGFGTNAAIKVEDEAVRKYVFDLTEEEAKESQFILDKETLSKVLSVTEKKEFKDGIKKLIVSESDKKMIAELCRECNIDEFEGWKKTAIEKLIGTSL